MTTYTVNEKRELVINPSAREIIVPKSERVFGTYNEHGTERKYFLCPRLIGNNVDLSECFIFVNYISSGGRNGQYLVEDADIAENNCIKFSWKLTRNVFDENRDAAIYFSVQAKKMVDGVLKSVFSTKMAQGRSYANVDPTDEILTKNADVIVQILERVVKLESKQIDQKTLEKAFEEYFSDNPTTLAKSIPTDDTLKVTADGKLAVNTTGEIVREDNTLPVTAGAVYKTIGNINALLETI